MTESDKSVASIACFKLSLALRIACAERDGIDRHWFFACRLPGTDVMQSFARRHGLTERNANT